MKFSERVKDIAAQEPFADLQDRLVALSEITERLALERKSIMCDRAESQVLEKLAEVQSRVINPTKALLRDRDSGIRALVKVL
jgi:two-component sensor histidine kinase